MKEVFKIIAASLIGVALFTGCAGCSNKDAQTENEIVEDSLVWYPGRTFNYKLKFNDLQSKQHTAASAIGLSRPPKDRNDAASMRERKLYCRQPHPLCALSYSGCQTRTGCHRGRVGRHTAAQRTAALPILYHFYLENAGRYQISAAQREYQFRHPVLSLLRHNIRSCVHALQ